MIEALMVFALGFLAAALLALFILPALSRRAERLARQRVEARFPASLAEIAAERDHFRASLAVEARKVEQRAEAVALARAADLAELGRRAVVISDHETELATRASIIESLGADLASTRRQLAETRETLAATQADLAARSASLDETKVALAALEAAHGELLNLAEERRLVIATLETTGESLRARLGERDRELSSAQEGIATRDLHAAELETRKAVLEHRVAALQHERDDRDRLIETMRAERKATEATVAALEARAGDLEVRLAAAMERGDHSERQLERVRADEHAASGELARHLEQLRAEKATAEGALQTVRNERRELRREVAALRRAAEVAAAARRLDADGDQDAAAGRAELPQGEGAPVASSRERRRPHLAAVNEAPTPAANR